MRLSYLFTCLLLALVVLNCSKSKDNAYQANLNDIPEEIKTLENLKVFSFEKTPSEKVEFTRQDTFGEMYIQLLPPTRGFGPSNAVDKDGRVFRVDGGKTFIHVYNSDGGKSEDIGREGRGPGEFLRIDAIHTSNDKLFIYDSNLIRLSIFSLQNLELLKIINFDTQMYSSIEAVKVPIPGTVIPFTENSMLIALFLDTEIRGYGYHLVDYAGDLITQKNILKVQSSKMHNGRLKNGGLAGISLPFSNKGLIAVSSDKIYTTNSKEIVIQVLNSEGKNENTIYYPFKNDPLEDQEVLDKFHPNIHSVVKSAEYPETWPALDNLLVDDEGRIWIAKIVDDKSIHQWSVLESSGELKASFEWPAEHSIKIIKNGKIYVEEIDLEVLSKHLKSYEFEFSNF